MLLRVAGVCGLLSAVAFVVGWVVGGLAQPDAYSAVEDDISDLGALTADSPWIYNQIGANLVGILVFVLVLGLWRELREPRSARVGVVALGVFAVGEFLDGFFRLDCRAIDAGCEPVHSWHSVAHVVESLVTVAGLFVAMFALAHAFGRVDEWSRLRPPTLVAAIATLVTFFGLFAIGGGLAARVSSTIFFAWVALVSYRLLQLTRERERAAAS